MKTIVKLKGNTIQLDQVLKITGLCHSGGFAHTEIAAGKVRVDGNVELRKRAKLYPNQEVSYLGTVVILAAEEAATEMTESEGQ